MTHRLDAVSVLVLDGHRFMQEILRTILAGLGIGKITTVGTIEEALRQLRTGGFDVVIADYKPNRSPDTDFVRLVRNADDGTNRFTAIIACTADTVLEVVEELRDAGVDEILAKPVTPRAVCDKIIAVAYARRTFVRTCVYFGPDRRRRSDSAPGIERRH